jgi:acyl-coenzyme A synthetase/AMP-(fatty) acid ligase
MNPPNGPDVPLVARGPTDILFRGPRQSFMVGDFLRDAARVAAELPEAAHVFNLCQDRYQFAVTLAAVSLRGQICILSSDLAPDRLRNLADRYGTVGSVSDDPAIVTPFRHYRIEPTDMTGQAAPAAVPRLPADQVAAVVFTSGSTGEPVACEKTWGMLVERSIAGGRRFAMAGEPPPSVVGMVPARHMYGFEVTLLLPLHAACSSWSAPLFYPSDVGTALAAVPAPRVLVTTPVQLRALLQADNALPELDQVISATAPLDPALAAEAEARWGTRVFEIFGATEVGSIASRRTVSDEAWTTYDGVSLASAEEDQPVRILAPGAPPGTISDVIDVLDPTRFRLLGRGNDLIKLGGRRASLAGLNRILTAIPGVTDGVFIVPDDLDRRPTARMQAFVIAPTRSAEDILGELRSRIDPIFLPRRIVRVDALPRNEVGKLPREALLALRTHLGEQD